MGVLGGENALVGLRSGSVSELFRAVLGLRDIRRYCQCFRSVYAVGRVRSVTRQLSATVVLSNNTGCRGVAGSVNMDPTAVNEIDGYLGCNDNNCGSTVSGLGERGWWAM